MTEKEVGGDILKQSLDLAQKAGIEGPVKLTPLSGGRNNKVYKLRCNRRDFLLKSYFTHEEDLRDRLGAEFLFSSFAWKNGIRVIPKPLASDKKNFLGLYEFVDGVKVMPQEVTKEIVEQALDFFVAVNIKCDEAVLKKIPLASEACFCFQEHINTLDCRIKRLLAIETDNNVTTKEAKQFIENKLVPNWERLAEETLVKLKKNKLSLDGLLPLTDCCLSPSDFGFHNAIVERGGMVRFIDFEYAGLDDPSKMVCDFFCQPDVLIPMTYFNFFASKIANLSSDPDAMIFRFNLLMPIYKLKWICIILNDFLPISNKRRCFANSAEQEDRKVKQLGKARKYLMDFMNENQ